MSYNSENSLYDIGTKVKELIHSGTLTEEKIKEIREEHSDVFTFSPIQSSKISENEKPSIHAPEKHFFDRKTFHTLF